MKLMRVFLVATLMLSAIGMGAAAATGAVTDSTVFYLDLNGDVGSLVESVSDAATGLNAVAVQVEGKPLSYSDDRPYAGAGSVHYANTGTNNNDGSFLYVADHPTLDLAGTSGLTLEAYIRPASMKLSVLFRKTQPGSESGYLFAMDANGRILFQLHDGEVRQQIRTEPGIVFPGEWTHVAATWDGTAMLIYVNGMVEAEGTWEQSLVGTDGYLGIGALVRNTDVSSWGQLFDGQLSSVRISNKALQPVDFLD